ncbi:alpha-amylase family glycosyl hydrolase [Jannaschia sp. S6380]|uniref:alpha-amylase family glycosyl hydrolase n=1 Tax=Jannaschia sp. S6380 TaxID=2926408 RepID=UPI001FF1B120|nr:alpha-amylase family glycosyl hydrolase [Jannaschia sp. S6380]MCK0167319.1 alpha-amylase family glycosyl hydrolase [Jannaschia sp. S6380]
MADDTREADWWRDTVIYQIYPRSYQDDDGDGVGDLQGIARRLDHLVELGIDAVWVSPIYPSPMADFGYDVADYTGIDPLFGTMDDFDTLLAAAHERGLKLILDFVPNHSSDAHPWFREARASRDNPKRDWYIWRDPGPEGEVPNNWQSSSGGSAWTWDATTEQYYLHTFLPEQPDLNWRNPDVRAAMLAAMRFWFEKGVDGFRLDVVYHCIKDEQFRDDPVNPDHDDERDPPFGAVIPTHSTDQPEVMPLVIEPMRALADEMGHRLLIGEIYLPHARLMRYYGEDGSGVQLPFNFALISAEWSAPALCELVTEYERLLPKDGWPNWVLGNHDQSRIATRIGPARAAMAAVLLLAGLRGTPTIYYGEEIGMEDVEIPPDRIRDPWERNMPGKGEGRDPCRTPMRWSDRPNSGFCPQDVEPWLPMGDVAKGNTVDGQRGEDGSMLSLYRALLALRRSQAALHVGDYDTIAAQGDLLLIVRSAAGSRLAIVLNPSDASGAVELPPGAGDPRILLRTQANVALEGGTRCTLPAGAAAIVAL